MTTEIIEKVVIRPRCPKCGHVQAVSVVEGHFICRCKTEFIIGVGYVTILTSTAK